MEFTNSIKADDNKHRAVALQPFMEAAWMFMEVLSHSAMGDEDRKMLRERFMECWVSSHGSYETTQAQVQAQTAENEDKLQRIQTAEESPKMTKDLMHERGILNAIDEDYEAVLEEGRAVGSLQRKTRLYERENSHGLLDNSSMVNNQAVVSKEVTVPRQREVCPSSGSPCLLSSLHVNHQKVALHPAIHATQQVDVSQEETKGEFSGKEGQSTSNRSEKAREIFEKLETKGLRESTHVNHFQNSFAHVVKQGQTNTTRQASQTFVSSSFLNEIHDSAMEKNGGTRVIVPPEIINRRIDFCKLSIIGRVVLAKGEEAWSSKKLRERLNEVWNFNSSWRLISLGKGYFHVLLTSQEELEKVWTRGVINIRPGVMRFQKWTFGFDPLKEKTSNAQVWFRFFNLPWCLWDSSILTALSRKIGSPIRFDNNTIHGDFGHYARVLIEVDLSKEIKTVLQLDCGRDVFDVKVVPENIPSFCKACSNIGHQSTECRMIRRSVETTKAAKDLNEVKTKMDNQERMDGHQNKGKGIQESIKGNQKDKSIEERVPDIGKQSPSVSLLQGAKDVQTSNKFAALEEYEDRETEKEDNGIQNSDIEEAKGDDQVQNVPLSKGDVQHTLKGIRMWAEKEKRNITQLIEKSGKVGEKEVRESHTPKTPKRWSDIQDEEDEKEDEQANSNFYVPQPDDVLSFERNGELTEIFMRNGEVRFTPISDKNKK